ncbi:hypothetical protein TIFTF001_011478 [Ficus carica]|uniref:Uncharacterized protein n=1 Tax=Ficus carica TaxID=3494 RepID=A0AA88AE62_FICCA|nr:hypothetical protein TIFTF001_011478 [Ficus carica]
MELLRILGGQDEVFQGTDYRPHLCDAVLETSSHTAQLHLYRREVGIRLTRCEVILHEILMK